MTVLRNSLARCNARHLRIKRLVQFIFADPIYHNALTNCAALSCRALRRVARMCSRTVSGTAYRFRHGSTLCSPTVEKILCRSPFSQRSHVGNLRQTKKQRETGVKRVETAGVYPLVRRRGVSALPAAGHGTLPPSADGESPAEVQRKTPRPLGANPLTQFVCPGQPVLKKLPPGQGEPPARFRSPGQPVQKKEKSRRLTICSLEILF